METTKLLIEETLGTPGHVDLDKGILYDCLLLGEQSRNGTNYPTEARDQAISLFEGAKINLSHPGKRGPEAIKESYTWDRRYGKAFDVRNTPDGIRGNVKVLKSHAFTKTLFEAASEMPEMFGFSPVMVGVCTPKDQEGKETCVRIKRVKCIDIVTDPGTTKSLFEELDMDQELTKELQEEAAAEAKGGGEAEAEYDHKKGHEGQLMHSVLDELESYFDHKDHELVHKRIGEHLKHHHKMHYAGDTETPSDKAEIKEAEREDKGERGEHHEEEDRWLTTFKPGEKVLTEESTPTPAPKKYEVTKVKSGNSLTTLTNGHGQDRDWAALLRK